MAIDKSSSVSPKAIVELINNMTALEKEELSRLLDVKIFEELRPSKTSQNGRRIGDPKFYLGTTPRGLNLEIPMEKFSSVLQLFLKDISPQKIEIFLSSPENFKELKLTPQAFQNLIISEPDYFINRRALIEMDDNEIITSGGGCISMVLNPAIMRKRNELASKIVEACGYTHQFKRKQFYAIVWDDEMEIKEQ